MTITDLFRLDDKVAVVTGASSGLGVAFAQALAEAGADVALGARRTEMLEDTAAQVRDTGRRALTVTTDVADPESCTALVAAAMAEYGRVDILVNNAGVGTAVPATRETPEQFRQRHRRQPQRQLLDGPGLRPGDAAGFEHREHLLGARAHHRRPAAGGVLRLARPASSA